MECVPAFGFFRLPVDHDVVDQPAFETATPAPDIDFDSVLSARRRRRSETDHPTARCRSATVHGAHRAAASPAPRPSSTQVRPRTPFLKLRLASSVACAASDIRAMSAQDSQPTGEYSAEIWNPMLAESALCAVARHSPVCSIAV